MKRIIGFVFLAVAALSLVACGGGEKTGVGYGLVHKHYVGEVTVVVEGKKIKDVVLEEYYLPYNAAALAAYAEDAEVPENVVKAGTKFYAKYYYVDGKIYTGSVDTSGNIQFLDSANKNIEELAKDEAFAKAYVEAVKANKVFIVDSATATAKSTALSVTGNAAKGFTKSTTGYWKDAKYPLGWEGNMAAMKDAFIKYGVDAEYKLNTTSKKWGTEDGATGATLVDFLDYQAVAKRAVANAK